jgi:ribosomal protein S21
VNWGIWRIVHAGLATRTEILRHWNIHDLYEAHDVLNAIAEAEARQRKEQARGNDST